MLRSANVALYVSSGILCVCVHGFWRDISSSSRAAVLGCSTEPEGCPSRPWRTPATCHPLTRAPTTSWSCSCSSSPWLSSPSPPWSTPYFCSEQVGVGAAHPWGEESVTPSACSAVWRAANARVLFIPTLPREHQRRALPRTFFILHSVSLPPPPAPSQRARTCSAAPWSCCATPSFCSGTASVSWSGTTAACRGWSWQVSGVDGRTERRMRFVEEWEGCWRLWGGE